MSSDKRVLHLRVRTARSLAAGHDPVGLLSRCFGEFRRGGHILWRDDNGAMRTFTAGRGSPRLMRGGLSFD